MVTPEELLTAGAELPEGEGTMRDGLQCGPLSEYPSRDRTVIHSKLPCLFNGPPVCVGTTIRHRDRIATRLWWGAGRPATGTAGLPIR
jgi:hypothetical protein